MSSMISVMTALVSDLSTRDGIDVSVSSLSYFVIGGDRSLVSEGLESSFSNVCT